MAAKTKEELQYEREQLVKETIGQTIAHLYQYDPRNDWFRGTELISVERMNEIKAKVIAEVI